MKTKKHVSKAPQKAMTTMPEKKQHSASTSGMATISSKGKETKTKTRIIAHFDCGFPNSLFIRGEGVATLSWDKGIAMKNISPNDWIWESDRPCSTVQFKVLINDNCYEQGENHTIAFGQASEFSPKF